MTRISARARALGQEPERRAGGGAERAGAIPDLAEVRVQDAGAAAPDQPSSMGPSAPRPARPRSRPRRPPPSAGCSGGTRGRRRRRAGSRSAGPRCRGASRTSRCRRAPAGPWPPPWRACAPTGAGGRAGRCRARRRGTSWPMTLVTRPRHTYRDPERAREVGVVGGGAGHVALAPHDVGAEVRGRARVVDPDLDPAAVPRQLVERAAGVGPRRSRGRRTSGGSRCARRGSARGPGRVPRRRCSSRRTGRAACRSRCVLPTSSPTPGPIAVASVRVEVAHDLAVDVPVRRLVEVAADRERGAIRVRMGAERRPCSDVAQPPAERAGLGLEGREVRRA